MSEIRINSISVENYRSFKDRQNFVFPDATYKKPVAIVGYNNCGKTNLLNAILYGLQVNFVSKDTFSQDDFHNRDMDNIPFILLNATSTREPKFDGEKFASLTGYHRLKMFVDGEEIEGSKIESLNGLAQIQGYDGAPKDDINYDAFGATRYFNIFYINFHKIKEEINTNKTSWGNLRSFLAKHIKKIVDSDVPMNDKKAEFEEEVQASTDKVLEDSELNRFIGLIKKNYSSNLRNDDCSVSFGLPNYHDIFLKMLFKVGLNGDVENQVPISHFGDGYISMFVMAVVQSISEFNTDDKCLFLFEEPESFLHENHQEYFYKTVLCGLAENDHQVIYTTHSDKMIDPFDTKGLIRLEINESNQTVKKYNSLDNFEVTSTNESGEVINYSRYNEFIKTIEPNLSKILFSKKVILVEGPNDVLVYKYAIKQKVLEFIADEDAIINKEKYADTFMNFENIAIVCHHGKATANYLIELCKHFKVDYFVINDWDFEADELSIDAISGFLTLEQLKENQIYTSSDKKAMITTNYNLIENAGIGKIHFNVKKLESVIGYDSNNKCSLAIWELLNGDTFSFDENLFPESLEIFLGLNEVIEEEAIEEDDNDLPF